MSRKSPGGKEKITDIIRLGKLVMNIPLFSFITPYQMNLMSGRFKRRASGKGETVFKQGQPGDRFYIVKDGEAAVERVENGKMTVKKKIGAGGFFGEIALIKNIPRTATVTAETSATLLYLSKEEFQDILSANILTGVNLDAVARERMAHLGSEVARICS